MVFGFLAATFVAGIIDTSLKGSAYLHSFGLEYPIQIAASLAVCCITMFTKNRRIQLTLLAVSCSIRYRSSCGSTAQSDAEVARCLRSQPS
jgi:hypothetical protein